MTTREPERPGSRDLAANRPGQAARARAVEVTQEAPVKSFIARALGVRTAQGAWQAGAVGEEEVARRLRKLGSGWHQVHAVPVGSKGSDIDHVVIGPPGVFMLNTKNHSHAKVWVSEKVVLVNGQRTDYLRNARFEAERASRLLSAACGHPVAAEAVIVVMAARLTFRGRASDVHVVGRKSIVRWLMSRPPVLSADVVDAIYERARREETWQR